MQGEETPQADQGARAGRASPPPAAGSQGDGPAAGNTAVAEHSAGTELPTSTGTPTGDGAASSGGHSVRVSSGGFSGGRQGGEREADAAPEAAEAGSPRGKTVVRTREQFMRVWKRFMQQHSLDTSPPMFNRAPMDILKLFRAVMKAGGHDEVVKHKGWARIGRMFNPPSSMTDLSFQTKKIYSAKLLMFEKAYQGGEVPAEVSMEAAAVVGAPAEAAPAKQQPAAKKPAAALKPKPASSAKRARAPQPQQQQQQQQQGEEVEVVAVALKGEGAAAAAGVVAAEALAAAPHEQPLPPLLTQLQVVTAAQQMYPHVGVMQSQQLSVPLLPQPLPPAAQQQQQQQQQPQQQQQQFLEAEWPAFQQGHVAEAASLAYHDLHARPPPKVRPHSQARAAAQPASSEAARRGPSPAIAAAGPMLAAAMAAPGAAGAAAAAAATTALAAALQLENVLPAAVPETAVAPYPPPLMRQASAGRGRASQQGGSMAGMEAAGGGRPPSSHRRAVARPARLRSALPAVVGSPEAMLGRRIGIFWDGDEVFYYGTVTAYDEVTQMHTIEYDDGDREDLALGYQNWVFADGRPSGQPHPQPLSLLGSGPAPDVLAPASADASRSSAKRARTDAGAGWSAQLFSLLGGAGQQQQQQPHPGHMSALPLPTTPFAMEQQPQQPQQAAGSHPFAQQQQQQQQQVTSLPPQQLVASGRNYRAFTAAAAPPGYEVFVLMPGLSIEEVSVRCWGSGQVLIKGEPRASADAVAAAGDALQQLTPAPSMASAGGISPPPSFTQPTQPSAAAPQAQPARTGGGGVGRAESIHIQLPPKLDTRSAQALFTPTGQLYVRVNKRE